MRLSYMYYLLKENYKYLLNLSVKPKCENIAGKQQIVSYLVDNWDIIVNALNKIKKIETYRDIIVQIYEKVSFEDQHKEYLILSPDMYKWFQGQIRNLCNQIEGVVHFFEGLHFDKYQNGFDVKMPPTNDFSEFVQQVNDFQKIILSCPYLRDDNEKVTLERVDVGSIWICFGIASAGIAGTVLLSNLGKIVDQAVKIKSHILTCKQQEEVLRSMKLKNELMEGVIKSCEENRKELIQTCVDELKSEIKNKKLNNGEEEEQVRKALSMLGDLMAKGMEIYASIDTPDEIKDLFPTSDKITSLPTPNKLLKQSEEN